MAERSNAARMLAFGSEYENEALNCPNCGWHYTHYREVVVYERDGGEDGPTRIARPGSAIRAPSDFNPSGRRNAVRIYFDCEACAERFAVDVVQHKGNTYMNYADIPPEESPRRDPRFWEMTDEQKRGGYMDFARLVNMMSEDVHGWAVEKGWWEDEDRNTYELVALMHTELSEAVEELRTGHAEWHVYYRSKDGVVTEDYEGVVGAMPGSWKPEGFGVELADVVIRVLDTCRRYGIPIGTLIEHKMRYNATRSRRHGGKRA